MTSFTEQLVAELATETSRILRTQARAARRKTTLIGKEGKLLDVLKRAEDEYQYALELELHRDQQQRLLSAVHRDCEKLRSHLLRVAKTWSGMGQYGGQQEIARFAPGLNTQDDFDSLIRRFDEAISLMIRSTDLCRSEERFSWKGRPRRGASRVSLFALGEFATIIRVFWVDEISPAFNFGLQEVFDDDTDPDRGRKEPNAATHLLLRAAQIIDARCTISDIRQSMESVRHKEVLYG
jgi:hypothetical protein